MNDRVVVLWDIEHFFLNNPKWNMISLGQIFLYQFKCVLYATTYVIGPYLAQSTRGGWVGGGGG